MKTNNMMKAACLMLMASATTSAFAQKMNIEHKGDTTIVKVEESYQVSSSPYPGREG